MNKGERFAGVETEGVMVSKEEKIKLSIPNY